MRWPARLCRTACHPRVSHQAREALVACGRPPLGRGGRGRRGWRHSRLYAVRPAGSSNIGVLAPTHPNSRIVAPPIAPLASSPGACSTTARRWSTLQAPGWQRASLSGRHWPHPPTRGLAREAGRRPRQAEGRWGRGRCGIGQRRVCPRCTPGPHIPTSRRRLRGVRRGVLHRYHGGGHIAQPENQDITARSLSPVSRTCAHPQGRPSPCLAWSRWPMRAPVSASRTCEAGRDTAAWLRATARA